MESNQNWHPVSQNTDGILNTVSGRKINLLEVTPEMIDIHDISNALGKICRFGGQTRWFYSVAQHSVIVSLLAPRELKLAALLHDAAEAYVGDIVAPLKHLLGHAFRTFERSFQDAIGQKYGVTPEEFYAVKEFDRIALQAEHLVLQRGEMDTWKQFCRALGISTAMLMEDEAATWFDEHFMRVRYKTMGDV